MGFIRISELSKEYLGFSSPKNRILAGLSFGYLGIDTKFQALKDIHLSANPGDAIGIIGRNGAGKSTLLKILSGVIRAESGHMEVSGSIRALLELSVGFNPELSGEENVYYNGLVWGYKPNEIQEIMDSVFEFAGLSEFRKVPLKNYSSGMGMRLGFSLATAKRPDILIVDEALAVGDASFQQKCIRRFKDFLSKGSIVILVSHDLSLVSHFCNRVLLLERGKLLFDGEPKKAVENYMLLLADPENPDFSKTGSHSFGDYLENLEVYFSKDDNRSPDLLFVGSEISLCIEFVTKQKLDDLTVGFHIDDEKGVRVFGTNTFHLGKNPGNIGQGAKKKIRFGFPVNFAEGKYSLGVSLHRGENHIEGSYFWGESLHVFEVERVGVPKSVGLAYLPVRVKFD
ncbi:ABC transporter ATP-binding protein [Leptospira kobayashii]|uniref:ABC transporter ATP-binding protein n=1 Tax=Leptospira kobayashii TaxID=1917830 RepID=A0ABN6KIL8_9LEPT|nr:ABC transporter ATP-binding protein [Leptospira kobayashii]BDA79683.1 ABC transporter ATP-binding protein [Leptospira kobayashii]